MPINPSIDLNERRNKLGSDAPKPENKKSKLFKHIMNGFFSISLGTIIGVLAVPLTATTGIAILIGIGTTALALSILEACTCLCTGSSASKNPKKQKKKNKRRVSVVGDDDMTKHMLTRLTFNTRADESKLSIKPLPWELALTKKNKTTIPAPSLARIAEESEEEEECEEQEKEIKPTSRVEEPEENKEEIQLTSAAEESEEDTEDMQLTSTTEERDTLLHQTSYHRS